MIKEICIQGLGFVGIATATVVASVKKKDGLPVYNVTAVDLNNEQSLKKIDSVNQGLLYFGCKDEEFKKKIKEAALLHKNLKATSDENVYRKADIIIVTIGLDVKKCIENFFEPEILFKNFKQGIRTIGKKVKANCLILIETTIPPGTIKEIIEKILIEEFLRRNIKTIPLICHSPERVMPGKNYLDSIINYWRNYSVNCEEAKNIAEKFLSSIINTKDYPIKYFDDTNATEILKILENSYRATNIAFIYEWTILAEKFGVNLFDIIDAIKKRKGTHDNIMKPGFGVGGYCLPKDTLLAQWSLNNMFKISDFNLNMSLEALKINDAMPLHTYNLIVAEIGQIQGKKILICGVSYLPDVTDLRNTPSKTLYDKIKRKGGICHVTDPQVLDFASLFDDNDIKMNPNLTQYDVIVYAVRYDCYINLDPLSLVKSAKKDSLIVDTFNILNDKKIEFLLKNRINVIGVGKGHIKKMKRDFK